MSLDEDLAKLPAALLSELREHGFKPERLVEWSKTVGKDRDARNRLPGKVEVPLAEDVENAPQPGSPGYDDWYALGAEAIKKGEVALTVLAGGMATRMGGVVKALVEALPGKTFLDLRLAEQAALSKKFGAEVPLWLMTSDATHGRILEALGSRADGQRIAAFRQCVSLRLTSEGGLFRDEKGEPSIYATGHGDFPEALRKSGLLEAFVARGGKTLWLANLDNLGATVDPALLGWHLAHRAPVTVEVVDKVGSDRGGGPVRHEGKKIVAEEFRLPVGFDTSKVTVFNTNTFLLDAPSLSSLDFEFTFVEVEKKVGDRTAVQFERLVNELTVPLDTRFVRVPRTGAASRFLPVKDTDELERRRPEIEAVVRSRGILG